MKRWRTIIRRLEASTRYARSGFSMRSPVRWQRSCCCLQIPSRMLGAARIFRIPNSLAKPPLPRVRTHLEDGILKEYSTGDPEGFAIKGASYG